jgi:hypothetical protein
MYVHWFINSCNISFYLSFLMHLCEDDHMSGRNMQELYGVHNSFTHLGAVVGFYIIPTAIHKHVMKLIEANVFITTANILA